MKGEKHISLYRPLHHQSDNFARVPNITIEFNDSHKTWMAQTMGPWLVTAKSLSPRRHTTLPKAIAYFITLAKMLAPGRPEGEGYRISSNES